MEKVSIDEVESSSFGEGSDARALSDPLGTTDVSMNHYRIAPGEGFPGGLHAHLDQEELFVVLDGKATFETLLPESGPEGDDGERGRDEGREIVVGEGEAIRFAPGEFQSGRNDADRDLVALALGAPRDSEDLRVPVACPDCGHADLRLEWSPEGTEFACPDCGGEHVPPGCPECGRDERRVALGDESGTVVVCPDCGAEADTPFENQDLS